VKITQHARRRFALRVDAVSDPAIGVRRMWCSGRSATDSDLSAFRAIAAPGFQYRVCRHRGGLNMLLVMSADGYIVTIIG
jgi:hypothetical protein